MWSIETIIALNRKRQEEYDRTHPAEAAERTRKDNEPPAQVDRVDGHTTPPQADGARREAFEGASGEREAAGQPQLTYYTQPLEHTLQFYLQ